MPWNKSNIPSQKGRLAIVTGVGGLGFETALALAGAGAEVVLAGRDAAKGGRSLRAIHATVPGSEVRFEPLDLADLASVRDFADRVTAAGRAPDILINNAGVMTPPKRQKTADDFELQFGTNYLGHFALTLQLLPLLSRIPAARVVSVSSIAHRQGKIDFADLQSEKRYRPGQAYAQSKLAMLMFAFELDRRAKAAGSDLISIAAHPGVARTDLFTNGPGTTSFASRAARMILPLVSHSAADGALPLLFAATAPEAQAGGYYGPTKFFEMNGPVGISIVAPQAKDADVARRLWDLSEQLANVSATF